VHITEPRAVATGFYGNAERDSDDSSFTSKFSGRIRSLPLAVL